MAPARGPAAKACRINLPPSIFRRLPLPKERRPSGSPSACATRCLHNGGSPAPPIYALKVTVSSTQFTAYIDPTSGRPDSQIQIVIASYQLIELGTGKMVLNDMTIAHVDYDIPGSQQRFAGQRARRDAEDRAIQVAADAIRNRLASYFVAGT
jgi:LPS-assembly lipoprotein